MDLSKSSLEGDMRDSGIDLTSPTSNILLKTSQGYAAPLVNTKKYTSSETVRALHRHNEDIEYNLGMQTLVKTMDNLMEKAKEVEDESENMLMRITEMNLSCQNLLHSLEDDSEDSVIERIVGGEHSPITSNSLASQQSTNTDTSPSLSQTSVQSLNAANEEKVSTPILKSPSVCSTNRSKVMDPVLNAINIQKMLDDENMSITTTTFMTQVPVPRVQLQIDQDAIPDSRSKHSKKSKGSMSDEQPKWNSTTKVSLSAELPPIKRKYMKKTSLPAGGQKLDMKTIKTLFKDQLQNDSEISPPQVTTSLHSPMCRIHRNKLVEVEKKAVLPHSPIHAENLTGGQLLNSLEPGRLYPACVSLVANEEPAPQFPINRLVKLQKDVANDALRHLPPVITKPGMGRLSYMSQRTGRRRNDNQEFDLCVNGLNASHVLPPIASKAGKPPIMPYKNQSHNLTETCTQTKIPTLPPISHHHVCQEYTKPVVNRAQNNRPLEGVTRNDGNKNYQTLLPSRPMRHRYM